MADGADMRWGGVGVEGQPDGISGISMTRSGRKVAGGEARFRKREACMTCCALSRNVSDPSA